MTTKSLLFGSTLQYFFKFLTIQSKYRSKIELDTNSNIASDMKPFYQIFKFFALFIGLVQTQDSPKVCNDQGTCFEGSVVEPGLATFQGIRYAQPPIGDLRFKAPIPINQNNLGTIDASEISSVKCPQHDDLQGI